MYDNHVPYIAGGMRSDPDTFVRGALFAVASIQQQFVTVPASLEDIDRHGVYSHYLWGHKRDAYRYLHQYKDRLHNAMVNAESPAQAILTMCQVPGLGIVKSAFVAQLMGFDVACLDTRNVQREGRDPDEYKVGKQARKFTKMVDRYVADTGGKAREYWDMWCQDVGERRGMTAEAVSKLHLTTIVRGTYAPVTVPLPYVNDDIPF